jgi:hypothetical protein
MKTYVRIVTLAPVYLAASLFAQTKPVKHPDVSMGRPKVYSYKRAFPLLDGRFQDRAAITVSALILNPVAANATRLDAIQTGIAAGVQFSPMAGAINSAATQNYTTQMNFQQNLLGQQQSLFGQLQTQQQTQALDQAAVDQLSPTDQKDPTNPKVVALNVVNNQITATNAQLASVKAQQAAVTAPTYVSPGTAPTPTALGTLPSLTPATIPTAGPNYPPSKQLEYQVGTIDDRLMAVLGAMTQPDSLTGKTFYLVEFDPSVIYSPGNKLQLHTDYQVSCDGAKDSASVVELYPRASSVNIADSKYRDSKISLTALLSLFSTSVSASYNREHLRQTSALAESSFVTGYGVGRDTFGWTFGKVFGADTVSPGVKTTYALVAVKGECEKLTVQQTAINWAKEGKHKWPDLSDKEKEFAKWDYAGTELGVTPVGAATQPSMRVVKMAYGPVAYDATKASSAKPDVVVSLEFAQDLDYELTLTANGSLVKRARDTFARATTANNSNTGLLEATALDPMTWIATGSRSLLLKLDPAQASLGFPQIMFSSPSATTALSDALPVVKLTKAEWIAANPGQTWPLVDIKVLGRTLDCGYTNGSCDLGNLPAPSYTAGTFRPLLVARHLSPAGDDTFYLTVNSVQTQVDSTGANTQFITNDGTPTWSSAARVAVVDDVLNKMYPLTCTTSDVPRLTCTFPRSRLGEKVPGADTPIQLAVADSQFTGGATIAFKDQVCAGGTCRAPLLWSFDAPIALDKTGWSLSMKVLGIDAASDVELASLSQPKGVVSCPAGAVAPVKCTVVFKIVPTDLRNLQDLMSVTVAGYPGVSLTIGPIARSVAPYVASIDIDSANVTLNGINLLFDQLQVGIGGKPFAVTGCDLMQNHRSYCSIPVAAFGKQAGTLYYKYGGDPVQPLNQTTAGVLKLASFTPPAAAPSTPVVAGGPAVPAAGAPASPVKTVVPDTKALVFEKDLRKTFAFQ